MKFFPGRKKRKNRTNTILKQRSANVKKDHAGISWHRMEGTNTVKNSIVPNKKKLRDLLLSPLSTHTPRTRKKRVFFSQFVMNDGWDELSFLSHNNSLLEEEEGIDRYTSVEGSPMKRSKRSHCNDKENTMMNPLHHPPPRFSRGIQQEYQRLDDISSKGWNDTTGKTTGYKTGYNRPSSIRFADLMVRSPNSIRFADLMVRSPIQLSRETALLDNACSPSGSSMQTSSTAPTKFIYANTNSSDESITLHTYDYDDSMLTLDRECADFQGKVCADSVLTLDRECDDFHDKVCADFDRGAKEHCEPMIGRNEKRLEYAVSSAARVEGKVLEECEKLGEGMNKDYERVVEASYEKMASTMMEFSKRKSFCIIAGDEQSTSTSTSAIAKGNSRGLDGERLKGLDDKYIVPKTLNGLSNSGMNKSGSVKNGLDGKRKVKRRVKSNTTSDVQLEEAPKPQKRPNLTFFQRGMCAYNTDLSELIGSP